jgi:3-phenylpropionate/trans-cinnamate dioxygenase ferredoxin reductase subunit
MAPHYDVLVVGGGHGGAQLAIALRQRGFVGTVAVLSDESDYPYERPPLSKAYLARKKEFDRILIRPTSFWDEHRIDMLLERHVDVVDPENHHVVTRKGEQISYGQLVWATGGKPRRLDCDGHDLAGVHTIRSRSDIDQIQTELDAVTDIVIVGGGYIGLEAAAVLAGLGKRVTVLEALDRVLARVAGEPLSRFYEAEHRAHGVELRLNTQILGIQGFDDRVSAVRLADGETLPCQLVVFGIGVSPAVEPLLQAGAQGDNGVRVDGQCHTSLADVFAVGDCAAHVNAFADGVVVRLESVQNAVDQATTVAKAILGDSDVYASVPTFWSDQYDLKLRTVGLSLGHDEVVVRGEPGERSFSLIYLIQGRVIALDCVNAIKDFAQGQALVSSRAQIDRAALANSSIPLKQLLSLSPSDTSI